MNKNLSNEFITGTPDMTPSGIAPEVDAIQAEQQKIAAAQKKANVPPPSRPPSRRSRHRSARWRANRSTTAAGACFGKYMRIHALGASNGLTYSQMGQYAAKPDAPVQSTDFNGGTNDTKYAQTDPTTGRPVSNGARELWVTETSLSTALYLAYAGSGSRCSGSSSASPCCSAASAS